MSRKNEIKKNHHFRLKKTESYCTFIPEEFELKGICHEYRNH